MDTRIVDFLNRKAIEAGKLSVRMTTRAGSGHPSSALSLVHVVTTLMYRQMRYDPGDPWEPDGDRLVLSEGHAVPVVYAVYADLGGAYGESRAERKRLTPQYCETLRQIDSHLDGHPSPRVGFPFFDAATGSLGQGLSVAAGLGLAALSDGIQKRIYAIIGDGESREGQIWEAVDFIADYGLTNVTPIFNANGLGQSDLISPQQSAEATAGKLEAYGLKAVVVDGHDVAAIYDALNATDPEGRTVAVVANTQKGWGVPALQGQGRHGKPLSEEDMEEAIAGLDKLLAELPPTEEAVVAPGKPEGYDFSRGTELMAGEMRKCDFEVILAGDKMLEDLKATGKLATRRAYGVALRELGQVDPKVVVLDGDVSNSTFSNLFAKEFPNRYFECRIAEQNMLSVAGGLAASGKVPFVSTFAKFLSRACDQVEMLAISGANVKLCGSHCGLSLAADGPSQMGLSDVAFFHSLASTAGQNGAPACEVFMPADAVATYECVRLAAEHEGMVYIRTARPDVPIIYSPEQTFAVGGVNLIADGDDLIFISNGYTLHYLTRIRRRLEKKGISAGLMDAYSLPLRSKLLEDVVSNADRVLMVVEDNYGGGLGSAVAELCASCNGARVHCMRPTRIPKSGRTADEVFDYCGLGRRAIIESVEKALGRGGTG